MKGIAIAVLLMVALTAGQCPPGGDDEPGDGEEIICAMSLMMISAPRAVSRPPSLLSMSDTVLPDTTRKCEVEVFSHTDSVVTDTTKHTRRWLDSAKVKFAPRRR